MHSKVLILALLVVLMVAAQGRKTAGYAYEQVNFSEAEPIQHPVPLPPAVLKALLRRAEVKGNLGQTTNEERNNPAQMFQAAEVHLHNPDEVDLVVEGNGAMSGADNSWFWVVLSSRKDPQVVLFAGGNSLELMATKTEGYRDIRSNWASAGQASTSIYKFDGRKYRLRKEKWRENR